MSITTNIFGYNFICDDSYNNLADKIIIDVKKRNIGITNLITPNAHGINMYLKYKELNEFCKSSKYVLPDGQPIVWLSKLTKHTIKQRLTGSDFFPVIFNKLKNTEFKCLYIMSNQLICEKLKLEKPDALYIVSDFFNMKDEYKIELLGNEIVTQIRANEINYIFIGISEPKQGAIAKNVTEKLNKLGYYEPCVFFFLGASYEFYLGLKKRAPKIFQKLGLEWFYRLIKEPRRMFKRYIIGNFVFLCKSLLWIFNKKIIK